MLTLRLTTKPGQRSDGSEDVYSWSLLMLIPTVHMNGTAGEVLRAGRLFVRC